LKQLEKNLDELNKEDAKSKAAIGATQAKLTSEERKLQTLRNNVKIDEKALATKEREMEQVRDWR